jgi:SAM-dependent methyltransferase
MQIDLGCGQAKQPGHVGLDVYLYEGVDLLCNLEEGLPFGDNSVDRVYANHVLEHIEHLVPLMQEIYRVCRPNAAVEVRVPYYASVGAFKDPTHCRFFAEGTFEYFSPSRWTGFDYGFGVHFEIVRISYTFVPPFRRIGKYLPRRMMALFKHWLWNIVHTMVVEMRVVK